MHNKIAQKLLSVGVSLSMMLAMVPLGRQNVVGAVDPVTVTIPQEMFITKTDLLNLCNTTNSGNGLLATGTVSDKVLKVNFGARPNDVKYYSAAWSADNVRTAPQGPITWLVAGCDTAAISGKKGLILYAEAPLIGATSLTPSSQSLFQFWCYYIKVDTFR